MILVGDIDGIKLTEGRFDGDVVGPSDGAELVVGDSEGVDDGAFVGWALIVGEDVGKDDGFNDTVGSGDRYIEGGSENRSVGEKLLDG